MKFENINISMLHKNLLPKNIKIGTLGPKCILA